MKFYLLALLMTMQACVPVFGATDLKTEAKYAPGLRVVKNFIKNSDCEINTQNITKSVGTLAKSTTTPLVAGAGAHCLWTPGATGTLKFDIDTLSPNVKAGNCEASFYTGTTTSGQYVAYLEYDSVKVSTNLAVNATTAGQKFSIAHPCGSSATTRKLVLEATTTPSAITIGGVSYGENLNIGTAAQASIYGGAIWPPTASCQWSTTSTSFGAFAADADCTNPTGSNLWGQASAPSTKIPAITFANLPPGDYVVTVNAITFDSTMDVNGCGFRLTDGTTNYSAAATWARNVDSLGTLSATGRFTYTTAQSNVTFSIQGISDAGTNTCSVNNSSSAYNSGLTFNVVRYPTVTQTAVNNPLTYYPTYSARITAGSSCTLATDVVQTGTWINGCTRAGAAAFTLDIVSGIFSSTPVCTVTPLRALANNRYTISAWFTSISTSQLIMQWAYNDDQQASIAAAIATTDDSGTFQVICQDRNAASAPAPLLVGGVSSNTSSMERIERANFTCSSSSTIATQSGSWISSIGNISSGTCSFVIASGIFATGSTPTCVLTGFSNPGAASYTFHVTNSSATAVDVACRDISATGVVSNCASKSGMITCMGPRN